LLGWCGGWRLYRCQQGRLGGKAKAIWATEGVDGRCVRKSASKWGKSRFFGPGGGPAGHVRGFEMETDARKVASGDKFGYTGLQSGVKMEISVTSVLAFWAVELSYSCMISGHRRILAYCVGGGFAESYRKRYDR